MKLPATIFRQYDIRGIVGQELTPAAARAVGQAYTTFAWDRLRNGKPPRVAVGRDNRPSGSALAQGLREGIVAAGGVAIDVGEVPTPAPTSSPSLPNRTGHSRTTIRIRPFSRTSVISRTP